MSAAAVELSVVIACRNGAVYLGEQLDALAVEQPSVGFEVVVADNGSTDATRGVVQRYADGLPSLRWVDASDRRGQAHARNVGARCALGTCLVFLDQDDVIAAGYLGAMWAALRSSRFVAAVMDYERLNGEWALAARATAVSGGMRHGLYPWAYGCVLGVRRDLFDAVGGFDEGLVCAEDIDLCWRVQRDGATTLDPAPGALLHYRLRSSPSAVFRQGILYGRGGPALYRRWAESGMERRSAAQVARSWAAIGRGLAGLGEPGRAAALYLLGNRLGCALGSVQDRVVYL